MLRSTILQFLLNPIFNPVLVTYSITPHSPPPHPPTPFLELDIERLPLLTDTSVESSADQLSQVIKIIFKNNQQEEFTDQLTKFVFQKEKEIEKMCNFHYQVTMKITL